MASKPVALLSLLAGLVAAIAFAQNETPVDDSAVEKHVRDAGVKLIENKTAVPVSTLIRQLDRSAVEMALPTVKPTDWSYAKAKHGVLVMAAVYKCTKCTNWHAGCAGGFLITADGKAVTNYHVVNQADKQALVAATDDGVILPVKEVLAADKAADVAIVQLDVPKGTTLSPLALAPGAEPGSRVRLVSHPDSHYYTLTEGVVSRYASVGGVTWLQVTAEYAKGSSGCPLFNERGQVVGMVASTESIYYTEENGQQKNLQMVIRSCVPVGNIRRMIHRP